MDQEETWRRVSERVRQARIAAGLSQERLAIAADWDQSTLSKFERNGPYEVSFRKLETLGSALGYEVIVSFVTRTGKVTHIAPEALRTASLTRLRRRAEKQDCVVYITFETIS